MQSHAASSYIYTCHAWSGLLGQRARLLLVAGPALTSTDARRLENSFISRFARFSEVLLASCRPTHCQLPADVSEAHKQRQRLILPQTCFTCDSFESRCV